MKLLFFAALLAFAAGAALAETIVLDGFTLIDGNGRQPLSNAAMIIVDGRIQWTGPKAQLKAPAGAAITHLVGKYVMPGIINLHGHLGNTLELTQDPKNFTRDNVEKQLKLYASYGVTSIVSMGTDGDLIFPMRAEQRAGRPHMTRIFTAGRGFTGVGGYPTTAQGMKGVPFEVATTAEVDRDVAQLADEKVDLVKIWVDDHLGREKKIPLDLAKAIIAEAHKHGLKVAAHIFYLDDAKALVNAGLDGLAHSVRDKPVDDELIASMKKRGAFQEAATLTREESTFIFAKPGPLLDDPFFTRGVSQGVLATLRSPAYQNKAAADPDYAKYPGFLQSAMQNLKKLADSGVMIGFGTDSGPPGRFQGYFEHWELQLMTEAGLTPMQVITAATHNAAAFLRAKDLGTLERGKWADLIVLGKNPLDDIRNTRSIEMVMIAGNKI
ncbi:MAG TPA: amidohydrolase family protein [Bryobacteraceae bacterium]|jgi:imidazolonepropionase-like amidohydrolase|nr:amidohydrolase family protein [Bryobacteraceae bacterium]